jgi:hypothetical protein
MFCDHGDEAFIKSCRRPSPRSKDSLYLQSLSLFFPDILLRIGCWLHYSSYESPLSINRLYRLFVKSFRYNIRVIFLFSSIAGARNRTDYCDVINDRQNLIDMVKLKAFGPDKRAQVRVGPDLKYSINIGE